MKRKVLLKFGAVEFSESAFQINRQVIRKKFKNDMSGHFLLMFWAWKTTNPLLNHRFILNLNMFYLKSGEKIYLKYL